MNIQWSLTDASNHAGEVDRLFFVLLALSAIVLVGVAAAIIYMVLKYRRGKNADRTNPVETNHRLELTWSILPLVISLGIFVWAGRLYFQMYDVPDNAMEVYVIAKQWMWKFQYPETGQIDIDTLRVPVGRPVKLTMTSEDVIHSLYVPAFRIKTDVLPGRYTTVWFSPTETGTFHLFCAEYCGTDHSGMVGQVIVMPEDEFQSWAGGGGVATGAQTASQAGEQLFTSRGCIGCHNPNGGGVGPSLVGRWGSQAQLANGETIEVNEDYVRTSILRPAEHLVQGYQPVMPSYEGQLSEDQLLQLIAYIQSLGVNGGGAQGTQQGGGQ